MRIRRIGSCRLFLVLFSVCFVLLLVLAPAQTRAQASQTINVSNGNVAGLTSAIQTLNSTGGGTIDLASGGTYSVTAPSDWWYGPNAFPAIARNITINGNGATISRASGSPNFRFFYVSGGFSTLPAGSLTLSDLTLSGGLAQGGSGGSGMGGGGGGAGMGGAIYNQGALTANTVTFTSNEAQGGSGGSANNFGAGEPGGGGLGGNGANGGNFEGIESLQGGGGGFRYSGSTAPQNGFGNGGGFAGGEGGGGGSGGTSAYGGNGSAPYYAQVGFLEGAIGGGGGGFAPGNNASGGSGALGGGNGGCCSPYGSTFQGGGGAFGGGGAGGADLGFSGGGGGVGGGGGGGGGAGGYGGGGGSAGYVGSPEQASVFGCGAGGNSPNSETPGGSPGFGGAPGASNGCANGTCGYPGNGGGGGGFGGAIFNQVGSVTVDGANFTSNSATGGAGNGTSAGYGGAIFNLNGSVSLTTITYSANTALNSAGQADGGAFVYNLSHNGGNTAAGQTPAASVLVIGTSISTINGDLVSNQVNGTASVLNNVSALVTPTVYFSAAGTLSSIQALTGGAPNLDFQLLNNGTCKLGTAYTAGQSCTVNVAFTPASAGQRNGAVVLYSASGAVLGTGYLSAIAQGAQITYSSISSAGIGSGWNIPDSVAVDGSGNAYVVDGQNNVWSSPLHRWRVRRTRHDRERRLSQRCRRGWCGDCLLHQQVNGYRTAVQWDRLWLADQHLRPIGSRMVRPYRHCRR